jgi:glucan phosphoethanolaminetransferase (alkaline phosphatase superfamily)
MYPFLLPLHSLIRWLLVAALLYCLISSLHGVIKKARYSKVDNTLRSITSGVSHVQLIIGLILYFKSPVTTYFRNNTAEAMRYMDIAFFGLFHIVFMLTAVVLLTIGASKAKRANTDLEKHKQVLLWFAVATAMILLAIPWPFSPYAARPFLRSF